MVPGGTRALKKLPYYKMYPSDAESDENFRLMDDAERGFYWRCLNHAWLHSASLPADLVEISRALSTPLAIVKKRWMRVGKCWLPHPEQEGRLINSRQWKERVEALKLSETNTKAVRKRYERSYERSENVGTDVGVSYYNTRYDSESESGSGNKSEIPIRIFSKEISAEWTRFIELWESKCACCGRSFPSDNKDLAYQHWISMGWMPETLKSIFNGLENHRASQKWHEGYVPAVPAWLGMSYNGRINAPRWNDKLPAYGIAKKAATSRGERINQAFEELET